MFVIVPAGIFGLFLGLRDFSWDFGTFFGILGLFLGFS